MKEYIDAYLNDIYIKYKYFSKDKKRTYSEFITNNIVDNYKYIDKANTVVIDNYPLIKKTHLYYIQHLSELYENSKLHSIPYDIIYFVKQNHIYKFETYFNTLLRKEKLKKLKI